ncbi:MAG: 4Fe-4S dicluster domain-containing protein, partial [Elusimicrobiota bacterium]
MAKVKNWQLKREMAYKYEAAPPKRQIAYVFDTNKCIACQTCTVACKTTWTSGKGEETMFWNNVETKPYGFYPLGWDVNTLAKAGSGAWKNGVYLGKTVFEAAKEGEDVAGYLPHEEDWSHPNIGEDEVSHKIEDKAAYDLPHPSWMFYLARICNHCTSPACLAACPRQAIYKRPEDGIVLIDEERCRGYRECVAACPYKKPMYNATTRVSEKCVGCYPRIEGKEPLSDGHPMETRCMSACVGQIRLQGLVKINEDGSWTEDRQNPLYYLIRVAKVALPLYPQFGTEPNGFYIPPRWVPRDYLKQMFGPGVDHAIEAYIVPDRELLAVLQLFRRSQKIIFRYEIQEGPKIFETERFGKKFEMF